MQAQVKHNFAIFKRISSALIIICVVVLAVKLWLMQTQSASQWYEFESEQLGRSLAQQAAKLIAPPMQNEQTDLLDAYVDMIQQDIFVQGAIIFNASGQKLHAQSELESVVDMLEQSTYSPLIFVEDIIDGEGNILGYLKLVLDRDQVTIHHRAFVKEQLSQTIIIILLTLIVASLITRLIYKFRYRHILNEEVDLELTQEENKVR